MKDDIDKTVELSDIPSNTDPFIAIKTARALVQYAQQFREVFPLRELRDMQHAEAYLIKVENEFRS